MLKLSLKRKAACSRYSTLLLYAGRYVALVGSTVPKDRGLKNLPAYRAPDQKLFAAGVFSSTRLEGSKCNRASERNPLFPAARPLQRDLGSLVGMELA